MKRAKKLLAVFAALCLLMGMVVATASAEATYEYTREEMDTGTYELALLETVEHTVYGFTPAKAGVYAITTETEGVTLHTYNGSAFFQILAALQRIIPS